MGRLVIVILCLTLSSCVTTKYVPIERVKTVYQTKLDSVRDSVMIHDSVMVNIITKGDSVLRYETRWKYHFRDRVQLVRDTVLRNDSVPVIVTKEKELTKWQKTRIRIGDVCVCALLAVIVGYVIKKLIKT